METIAQPISLNVSRGDSYSYTSTGLGFAARAQELVHLARVSLGPVSTGVDHTVRQVETAEERVRELTGLRLENLKVLDIGPGGDLRCARCFGVKNEVVGIDTDVIPQGFRLGDYVDMLRSSPPMRSLKTIGRKAIGHDARFAAGLARRLGVARLPHISMHRMSATDMSFPSETFGFVYSFSVFEHIDDPEAAMNEVARVLQPGGVAYISLHLYTCHSGQHDARVYAQGKPCAPLWPHLRPAHEHSVHPNSYLNRLRLRQWRTLFERAMPGVEFVVERDDHDLDGALAELRSQGELAEYEDEELMTVNLIAVWRKPRPR